MKDKEIEKFSASLRALWERYSAFPSDKNEWSRRVKAYFLALRYCDLADVLDGLSIASRPEYYPDRFPTSGQLERVVRAAKTSRLEREAQAKSRASEQRENDAARAALGQVPPTAKGQAEWVQEAPDRFEALARVFLCESRVLGLDPSAPSPPGVAARRQRALFSILHTPEGVLPDGRSVMAWYAKFREVSAS